MVTAEQYADIRKRIDTFERWHNSRTSYRAEDVPANVSQVTNEERSACELYEFVTNPPARYFIYIKQPATYRASEHGAIYNRVSYGARTIATTWIGEQLGTVVCGEQFRSSFGDWRVPITVHGINGKTYHGTYYMSAGDYARIKLSKR